MRLVERHIIQPRHRFFCEIDRLCWQSKNLYNYANYKVRQSFIFAQNYRPYNDIQKTIQGTEPYQALPAKVSQQILRKVGGVGFRPAKLFKKMVLDRNWKSFLAANQAYQEHPEKFLGRPKLPKYKNIETGRNLLIYTIQALSQRQLKQGIIHPSKTEIYLRTTVETSKIKQVRIIPRLNHYVIEVIYEAEQLQYELEEKSCASIDIGLNNLATLTFNQAGIQPLLINGRPLKSINQYYNKVRGRLQAFLPKNQSSRRLKKLCNKREFKVNDYLHKASRLVINTLIHYRIRTLILGKNPEWKQKINLRKKTNQNFVQIPHAKFIELLSYKAKLAGIQVILTEESYTSQASFLDKDNIPVYKKGEKNSPRFSGKRVKRGLYRTASGRLVNADVNGSLNIMRKAVPNALSYGVEGVVVHPVRVTPTK
ncbi:MAG: transposase [Cyanobacteria bacterium J06592_8]